MRQQLEGDYGINLDRKIEFDSAFAASVNRASMAGILPDCGVDDGKSS